MASLRFSPDLGDAQTQPYRLLSRLTLSTPRGLSEWPEVKWRGCVLEGLFPQLGCLPCWALAAAAQPGLMPRPLLPTRGKGRGQKPIHEGATQVRSCWRSPREAPCLPPSRQVLQGASAQLRAGKPPSFLPPSHHTPRPGSAAGTHPFPSY